MNFEIIYKSPLYIEKHHFCIMQGTDKKPSISDAVVRVKSALNLQRIPTYNVDSNSIVSIIEIA